jgi:hypothetical protein
METDSWHVVLTVACCCLLLRHRIAPALTAHRPSLRCKQQAPTLKAAKTLSSTTTSLLQRQEQQIRGITWLVKNLEAAKCPYMLVGSTAALAQGAEVDPTSHISAEVQWDFLPALHTTFKDLCPSPIQRVPAGQHFTMERQGKNEYPCLFLKVAGLVLGGGGFSPL